MRSYVESVKDMLIFIRILIKMIEARAVTVGYSQRAEVSQYGRVSNL
jgi:hypothetical protein